MEIDNTLQELKKELRILRVEQEWNKGKIAEFRDNVESNKLKLKSLKEKIVKLTPID
jgi:peptidoglycan hydrolase CwlO-like protein